MKGKIEKEKRQGPREKSARTEREELNDFCKRKGRVTKTERDLAVLKRSKRAAESGEIRTARLKQQEIFIPQWPELAIID